MTAARPFRLTRPVVKEHAEQRAVTDMMRLEVAREGHFSRHGVTWFSVDHAHFAGVPGTRIARGICAGVPDMVVLWLGLAHWVEMKKENGELSQAQREVCTSLLWSGCHYGIARDVTDVLALLDAWQIPRNRRVRAAA
jgi:uncharacterized protein YqjF (DUF2071 family)